MNVVEETMALLTKIRELVGTLDQEIRELRRERILDDARLRRMENHTMAVQAQIDALDQRLAIISRDVRSIKRE